MLRTNPRNSWGETGDTNPKVLRTRCYAPGYANICVLFVAGWGHTKRQGVGAPRLLSGYPVIYMVAFDSESRVYNPMRTKYLTRDSGPECTESEKVVLFSFSGGR